MRKVLLAVVAAASLSAIAFAAVRPSELEGSIAAQKPYGTGSLTWLFLTAYEASLWTDAPTWSMDAPFALTLKYSMSFTREDLVERTIEEMRKVSPGVSREALTRYGAALSKAYPDVKSGDTFTALHVPGRPVRFFHNGRMTSAIDDPAFADPFFGIWLSPKTSEPKLRAGLLGLSG